jgi:O-antigen/teichoic acid export membrane protein
MAVGAGWMLCLRFADRFLGLVNTVILARLLVPGDFGLVALATALIAMLEMMGELSVEAALIRDQHAQRREYDTAWTMNVIKGLLLGGALALLAVPASRFFSEGRLEAVVYWLALAVAMDGFQNIGTVNFRRDLQFHRDFLYLMTSRTVATLVTIALAFLWRDYWALVAGMLAQRVAKLALGYLLSSYRPRLSLDGFAGLFRFSRWLLIENFLTGLRRRADTFALGKLADAGAVGTYAMASQIANLSLSEVDVPLRRVLFPGFAKLAATPALLKKSFLGTFALITLVAMPVTALVALTAHLIVPVVLGPKWLDTIPLIQILIVQGFVNASGGSTRPVYLAMNRPAISTAFSGLSLLILVPLLVVGTVQAGVIGTACAVVVTAILIRGAGIVVAIRLLHVRPGELLAVVWRIAPGALAMAAAVRLLEAYWPGPPTPLGGILHLGTALAVGTGAYLAAVFGLWLLCQRPPGPEEHLLDLARGAFRRLLTLLRTSAQRERTAARAGPPGPARPSDPTEPPTNPGARSDGGEREHLQKGV